MNLDISQIDKLFVKESYRDGQKEAIEFVLKAYNQGKKIVIIEAPTGSGKTAIGMTVANFFGTSYYITSSKQLQDQIMDEFGDTVIDLKGRNAYPCTFYERNQKKLVSILPPEELRKALDFPPDCNKGFCKTSYSKPFKNKASAASCKLCFTKTGPTPFESPKGDLDILQGTKYSMCPYYERIFQALSSRKVVMNFSSYLYQTSMSKRFKDPRDIIIIDEAHNIETQLMDMISLTISDKFLINHHLHMPSYENAKEYAEWFTRNNVIDLLMQDLASARQNEEFKEEEELVDLIAKLVKFIEDISAEKNEWISQISTDEVNKQAVTSVQFKPVFVSKFVYPYIFQYGKMVLMMSATILDINVLCKSLGIDKADVATYRMKNRFPAENRPIYIRPVGKFTGGKAKMVEWAPKLLRAVEEICDQYKDKRGIIHTHNFAIHDYVMENCKKSLRPRLLSQKNFATKQDMLEYHKGQKNTILIAPAMHEGVDLYQDLSRFQIICKVPFANCFDDLQLKRRVELDRRYYVWTTAIKLLQSYGRSIRSEDDYADTFILDESIIKFLKDADTMLPSWFLEAIKIEDKINA